MRLLIRLAGGTGTPVDLQLTLAEDVTVGELADHLATRHPVQGDEQHPATLRVHDGASLRCLDRRALVAEAGPRSGGTVSLGPDAPPAAEPLTCSPVRLVPPNGAPLVLRYGTNSLHGARVTVAERVELTATDTTTPSVNGERVLGDARLQAGDLVVLGEQAYDVRIDAPLRPPPPAGPTVAVARHPEHRAVHSPVTIDLPVPPGPARTPGFPVLSATVPLLMGVGLWLATRSATSALFVLFSFVFVVASGLEARREARAEARFREAEFRADLAERADRVRSRRRLEQRRAQHDTPPARDLLDPSLPRDPRLWARTDPLRRAATGASAGAHHGEESGTVESGPLRVRLGTAPQAPADRLGVPSTGRRDLLAELRAFATSHELLELPVVVDLGASAGLAVVGTGERPTAVGRAVVAQLAALVGPDDLGIDVVAAPERADRWAWCAWLPHHRSDHQPPRRVVVVDGGDPLEVAEAVDASAGEVHVVWLCPDTAGLPAGVGAVLCTDHGESRRGDGGGARLLRLRPDGSTEAELVGVHAEELTADEALRLARSLAPLEPATAVRLARGDATRHDGATAERCTLSDLLGGVPDADSVRRRWQASRAGASLGAALGAVGRGVLRVDLRADGPHALVAGTTGAGKSELLRTLVASLALQHPPDRLNFLLVDYKGGAAFGALQSLPHTVGLVTDLDAALARRALRSLAAEVRHREQVLAAHGVADLVELDRAGVPGQPAALVVVVDEFAVLARELPEFIDGLVDLAQRGRSLGIHLVLATQRPAGVVTDAIRANTTLRIALRVADEDDSRDVVEDPSAARLPRGLPGRAVLRLGPDSRVLAQVAWTGGPPGARPRIEVTELVVGRSATRRVTAATGPGTELDLLVGAVQAAQQAEQLAPPRRPWVDPLPDRVGLEQLPPPEGGVVHLGWVDRPDEQRRAPLVFDPDGAGGALILGAARSGRSTTLATMATALRGRPGRSVVHLIGPARRHDGGGGPSPYDDVIGPEDAERVLRLLRATAEEVRRRLRHPDAEARHRVLMVDSYVALEEVHERTNRGEALDLLTRIAREGASVGVQVVVAAGRRSEVPAALACCLPWWLQLRPPSGEDAVMDGLPQDAADPATPPGRAHLDGHAVQVALPDTGLTDTAPEADLHPPGPPAERVPRLPTRLTFADLGAGHAADGWRLPIGLDGDQLEVVHLDLTHQHALVAGPPRAGVSTTLATLARGVDAAVLLHGVDPGPGPWWHRSPWDDVPAALELLELVTERAAGGERVLVVVDDAHELLEHGGGIELDHALVSLATARRRPVPRLVLGGEADALTRCYSELLTRVRSGRTGVLLAPDRDLHPGLLHAALPRREELPSAAGRGWVLQPGAVHTVQVAYGDPV